MAAFVFDDFVFDDVRYQLTRAGTVIKADTQVLELLSYLLKNPGRVVTKEELIDEIWQGRVLGDNVISVCVAKLRKALGGAGNRCIGNVYGRGYRFMRPVATRETQRTGAPVPMPPRVSDSSLVGRGQVMSQLETALTRAQSGRGVMVALLGEAGIGKTRVAEELERRGRDLGFQVAWGHCHPFGDVPPLWPFLQLLRAWGLQLPAATPNPTEEGTEAGERENLETWHSTVLFMTETVSKMAAGQPQLIVLEDVQWADGASLQLLSHLAATVAQLPVAIVLTVRDGQLPLEPRSRRTLDYVLGHRDCTRITLGRLTKADVDAYTSALFGSRDQAITEAVFAKSEGNPFFMVELLRPFADGERPEASELTLSGPALDIVRQTLQQLSPESREVLAAAAVIGRSFDLGLLSLMTQRDPDALIELLEIAMTRHVIVAERDSHTRFAFGHDLIRDVLYDDLPSIARARLHLRVAEGVSQRSGSDNADAELAHHLLSALPAGDVSRAVAAAQHAARAAVRIGAHLDACVLLRRALEALQLRPEIDPQVTCELHYDLARFERAAGEPAWAKHLEQTVELARRHRLVEILVSASQLVSGPPGTVSTEGAVDVLEAALAVLPETERAQRAMLLAHLAWTPPTNWSATRVNELVEEAEALAATSGTTAIRTVMRARLYYSAGPDDHERALALASTMERLVSPHAQRQRARWALEPELTRLLILLQRGQIDQAQRALEAFGAAAQALKHAELIWHYDRLCVIMRMNAGDFTHARARFGELKQRAEQLQLHARRTIETIDWGELFRLTTGNLPASTGLVAQLRPTPNDPPSTYAGKLRLMTQFGLREEARAELAALPIERLRGIPKSRDYLAIMGHFAGATVETRLQSHAGPLYEILSPYPHLCVVAVSMHSYGTVSRQLAGLADVLGKRAEAASHFETSLEDCERFGLFPQLALTRHEYATFLANGTTNERKCALEHSRRAHELAEKLGMKPLVQACQALQASLETPRAGTGG